MVVPQDAVALLPHADDLGPGLGLGSLHLPGLQPLQPLDAGPLVGADPAVYERGAAPPHPHRARHLLPRLLRSLVAGRARGDGEAVAQRGAPHHVLRHARVHAAVLRPRPRQLQAAGGRGVAVQLAVAVPAQLRRRHARRGARQRHARPGRHRHLLGGPHRLRREDGLGQLRQLGVGHGGEVLGVDDHQLDPGLGLPEAVDALADVEAGVLLDDAPDLEGPARGAVAGPGVGDGGVLGVLVPADDGGGVAVYGAPQLHALPHLRHLLHLALLRPGRPADTPHFVQTRKQ